MSEQSKILAMYSAKRKLKHLIGQRLTVINDGQGVTSEILEMIKESHAQNFADEVKLKFQIDHKGVCTSIHLSVDDWETFEVIGLEDEINKLNEFIRSLPEYLVAVAGAFCAAFAFVVIAVFLIYAAREFMLWFYN